MIKCSNCGMLNIDGTLLCEGCAWDVSMEPRVEDTDPAAAAAAEVPGSNPSGSFDVLQPSGSFDALPAAEVVPLGMEGAEFESAGLMDEPVAPPVSQVKGPTAVQPPLAAPVSQVKAPTAVQPPVAAPVSQVKAPTAVQPPVSQVKAPTAGQPPLAAPASQVRPPTGVQPAAPQVPRVSMLAPELRPRLVVVRGLHPNVEFPVYDGPNFIGRFGDSPVDIDLVEQEPPDNPRASRQHACLTYENGAMFIQDLGSANGTFINRIRVTPNEKRPLKNGDYIQTGTVLFLVKEGGII